MKSTRSRNSNHSAMMNKPTTPFFLLNTVFLFTVAILLSASVQAADTETTPPSNAPAAASTTAATAAPTESAETSAEAPPTDGETKGSPLTSPDNVSLDFNEADIRSVLRIISLKSGVNIVAGEEVSGPVTVRLVDVPWEKALSVVLKTYGFAYERDQNIIRVTTLGNLASEQLETEIFSLTHAKANEVVATLQEMLTERGSMRADERTNVLIVTDVPTIVYRIGQVVQRLDKGTPQVLIEAKMVEMTITDAEKIGVKWNAAMEITGPSRPHTFPWDAKREDFLHRFEPLGKPGDESVETTEAGSSVLTTSPDDFPLVTREKRGSAVNPAYASVFPYALTSDFQFGKIDFSQFSALIEAISSGIHNKILSEPRVTVLSNQEATILVGEEIYIPTYERNNSTGKMEITGYIPKNIGIEMKVTPQVNQLNEVNLLLAPQISSLVGFEELTPEIKVPRINIRNATTKVRVKSGETVVLGGLIKEDVVDEKTKFPVLGDLPVLDRLFSHTNKTVVRTDLTFFITVTVVNDPGPGIVNAVKPS